MFGLLALLCAMGAAGWLLYRAARSSSPQMERRNVAWLKGVVFLGLVSALLAAKLWPLAFMVLLASGGVTAIEIWRSREIERDQAANSFPAPPRAAGRMDRREAASVLGVPENADREAVKAAHKRLISQLHPDRGGTDYLAAKINEARDLLLASSIAEPGD